MSKRSRLNEKLSDAEKEIQRLQRQLVDERWARICAQRGLVREIREHCRVSGHTVGYDPDQDPDIVALVKAGVVPERYDPLKETVAEMAETIEARVPS